MTKRYHVTNVTSRNTFKHVRVPFRRNERNNTLWGVTFVTLVEVSNNVTPPSRLGKKSKGFWRSTDLTAGSMGGGEYISWDENLRTGVQSEKSATAELEAGGGDSY